MNQVLHVDINSPIPSIPGPSGHCFDENTQIIMNNGLSKTIKEIEVGDKLANNNTVTSKLKLDAMNSEMYQLGNIIVSGSHRVKYKDNWIFVKDHPERNVDNILSYSKPYIYCLNTDLKTIRVDEFEFSDWDEIFDEEKKELLSHLDSNCSEDIHKYYNGGFYPETNIVLENGETREIRHLEVGTILKDGIKVVGLIEIYGENLGGIKEVRGLNVHSIFIEKKLNLEKNIAYTNYLLGQDKTLFHLLTDKKYFYIDGIKYFHYTSQVELFLEKYRGKLLSMKYV